MVLPRGLLEMDCDEFFDMIGSKYGIDVKKVKTKCAANAVATVTDLDSLDEDELKDCGIKVGLKVKVLWEINQAKIVKMRAHNSPSDTVAQPQPAQPQPAQPQPAQPGPEQVV